MQAKLRLILLTGILLVGLIIAAVILSPEPSTPVIPRVAVTGQRLNFPFVPVAPFKWQPTGYGRPWQTVGRDVYLHNKSMWAYTWGPECKGGDIPMWFTGNSEPNKELLSRCEHASVLLVFNEPEWGTQGNTKPEQGAEALRKLEQIWPGELWCCGNLVSHSGWLDQMLTVYWDRFGEVPRIAGIALHIYINNGFDVADPLDERWIEQHKAQLDTYLGVVRKWGLPERIVVTECCLLGKHTDQEYIDVMDTYMRWLRTMPEVESVAWFSSAYGGFPEANLMNAWTGVLRPLGNQWLEWRWK